MNIQSIKFIGVCDERILTHKGFKKLEKINNHTIRLFNAAHEVKQYLENKMYSKSYNVAPVKIKVTYEVIG